MLKYKTIANLKNAGPEDLSETAGVNINIANELYNLFRMNYNDLRLNLNVDIGE